MIAPLCLKFFEPFVYYSTLSLVQKNGLVIIFLDFI